MKTWTKVLIVTLFFGIPAFLLGPVIWPISADFPPPAPEQIPYFIVLSVFDSLFFGLGIAFVLFGWPLVRRMAYGSRLLGWALYLSIAFLLISWWPHINLHNTTGFDLQGLLYIDYGFHIPLMIAGAVVAYGFLNLLRWTSDSSETAVTTARERMSTNV
jgi:hypothetical protein